MGSRTTRITEVVELVGNADQTFQNVRIKIPGKLGKVRDLRVFIPTGPAALSLDVLYTPRDDIDMSNIDAIDPLEARGFLVTGITYAGSANPPGPKAAPLVPDSQTPFGENAIFDARDEDTHRLGVRVTGSGGSPYLIRIQLAVEIWA